jgi:hypothetical protein
MADDWDASSSSQMDQLVLPFHSIVYTFCWSFHLYQPLMLCATTYIFIVDHTPLLCDYVLLLSNLTLILLLHCTSLSPTQLLTSPYHLPCLCHLPGSYRSPYPYYLSLTLLLLLVAHLAFTYSTHPHLFCCLPHPHSSPSLEPNPHPCYLITPCHLISSNCSH